MLTGSVYDYWILKPGVPYLIKGWIYSRNNKIDWRLGDTPVPLIKPYIEPLKRNKHE